MPERSKATNEIDTNNGFKPEKGKNFTIKTSSDTPALVINDATGRLEAKDILADVVDATDLKSPAIDTLRTAIEEVEKRLKERQDKIKLELEAEIEVANSEVVIALKEIEFSEKKLEARQDKIKLEIEDKLSRVNKELKRFLERQENANREICFLIMHVIDELLDIPGMTRSQISSLRNLHKNILNPVDGKSALRD